jgi:hypothetical protein
MSDKIEIPRRRVKKNWYVGLHSDPVDRSHPDVDDELLVVQAAEKMSRKFLYSFQFFYTFSFHFGPCFSSLLQGTFGREF